MTYCVGVMLDKGMIFASDSRTNAGLDNIAKFCKMTVFERRGDRVIVLLSSGNLAGTQAVIGVLNQRCNAGDQIGGEHQRLFRIYAEGNFIEAGVDTPYLQTGETKYGKPIIDRVISDST